MTDTYETDFFAWTQAQAAALRATRPNNIDWANIAEELETMGRSERREVENRIRLILTHLLQWRYQSWMRTPSWRHTLRVQRRDLEKVLRESPSLRPSIPDAVRDEYEAALRDAYFETGLRHGALPENCPFSPDQVLDPDYLPDAVTGTGVSPGAT